MKESIKLLIRRFGGKFLTPPGVDWMVDIARLTKPGLQIKTVFDVGANVGQTSLRLAKVFPAAKIWAFEPIKSSFEALTQNLSSPSTITPIQVALGAYAGKAKARVSAECSLTNTLLKPGDESDGSLTEVPVNTIDAFCLEHGIEKIDILKSDTEGYDLEVFKGADVMLSTGRVRFVYVEVQFPGGFQGLTPFQDAFDALVSYNFRFLGLYETYPLHFYPEDRSYCNALFVHRSAADRQK